MQDKKLIFFNPNQDVRKQIHMAQEGVSAGFPSPADDFKELRIE